MHLQKQSNKQKAELEGRLSKLDKSYTSEFENRVKSNMVAANKLLKTAIEAQDVDGQIKSTRTNCKLNYGWCKT